MPEEREWPSTDEVASIIVVSRTKEIMKQITEAENCGDPTVKRLAEKLGTIAVLLLIEARNAMDRENPDRKTLLPRDIDKAYDAFMEPQGMVTEVLNTLETAREILDRTNKQTAMYQAIIGMNFPQGE
ncbi:hypothetical protein JZ785_10590 [Alicyclobacillus curvatus]|nr:hypothetical protein JZ785_10590 [Alicyclobacillus curvatus]